MAKYVVTEMQNGVVGGNTWAYDSQDDAEVKMFQVLSEVVKSPVAVHTVTLETDEGWQIERRCYHHQTEAEAEAEAGAGEE